MRLSCFMIESLAWTVIYNFYYDQDNWDDDDEAKAAAAAAGHKPAVEVKKKKNRLAEAIAEKEV